MGVHCGVQWRQRMRDHLPLLCFSPRGRSWQLAWDPGDACYSDEEGLDGAWSEVDGMCVCIGSLPVKDADADSRASIREGQCHVEFDWSVRVVDFPATLR